MQLLFFVFFFVPCRIESYSCKMAGDDKHMFKQFCQEGEPHVLEALSPPQSTSATSPSQSVVQLTAAKVIDHILTAVIILDVPVCLGWGRAASAGTTLWVTSVAGRPFSTSSQHSTSPSGPTTTSVLRRPTSSAENPVSTGWVPPLVWVPPSCLLPSVLGVTRYCNNIHFSSNELGNHWAGPTSPQVANAVNSSMFSAVGEEFNSLGPEVWSAIDQEINLQGCDIYR